MQIKYYMHGVHKAMLKSGVCGESEMLYAGAASAGTRQDLR